MEKFEKNKKCKNHLTWKEFSCAKNIRLNVFKNYFYFLWVSAHGHKVNLENYRSAWEEKKSPALHELETLGNKLVTHIQDATRQQPNLGILIRNFVHYLALKSVSDFVIFFATERDISMVENDKTNYVLFI